MGEGNRGSMLIFFLEEIVQSNALLLGDDIVGYCFLNTGFRYLHVLL